MFIVMSGSIVVDGPEVRRLAGVLREARGFRTMAAQTPYERVVHLGEVREEEVRHPVDRLESGRRRRTLLRLDRWAIQVSRRDVRHSAVHATGEPQQVV